MRLLLVGCSSDANIYHSFVGQRVVGNTNYVSVSNVWNEMDGSPLAEKPCAQYGKAARFTHMEAHRAIYDCVSPLNHTTTRRRSQLARAKSACST